MKSDKFDASGQAIGYLHQVRSALLLGVLHDESSDILSLEVVDDVSFAPTDGQPSTAAEVLQYKHSLTKTASLTDKSVDLWKTLRVWSEKIRKGELDPEHTIFSLVATATASPGTAVALLRSENRNVEEARNKIEAAGAESSNKTVIPAFKELSKLKVSERKLLFKNMFLIDASPDILNTRLLIERELRFSVEEPEKHLKGFADRLEGWWFRVAVEHLSQKTNKGIQVSLIHRQIRDLLDQFKRDNLPDDLLDAIVPADQTLTDDHRTFVAELRRVFDNRRVIRVAQDDHYRAYEQRSRWVRETLLRIEEEEAYEERLLNEWASKVAIALDGIEKLDGAARTELGKRIYEWVQESAGVRRSFFIRPEFVSAYMARGSCHMLVDKARMIWHPDDIGSVLDKLMETADNA